MQGWQPRRGPGLRLAARRAHVDQSEPERCRICGWRALCRHGDARRHDAVGRPRHDAPARAVRRAGHRRARAARRRCTRLAPQWLRRLPTARCAGSSRPSTSTSASCARGLQIHVEDPSYDHDAFRPWRLQALAFKALRRCSRTIRSGATSRTSTRRPPRDRRDQRRPAAARMGRRRKRDGARRSRSRSEQRRARLAQERAQFRTAQIPHHTADARDVASRLMFRACAKRWSETAATAQVAPTASRLAVRDTS